jgi:hypothetical protein
MNTRYCIMTSPRSGSNLLEDEIFKMIAKSATTEIPAIRLGEFLHYSIHGYFDSNGKNFLTTSEFNSEIRKDFRKEMVDIVENGDNPMTVRIFPQPWHDLDYVYDLLTILKNNGFKFIYLRRNLIDRVISLAVAQKTNFWQQHKYYKQRNNQIIISENNKLSLSEVEVQTEISELRGVDLLTSFLFNDFSGEIINYENFKLDCERIGIQISDIPDYKKTYDVEYKHLIENYDEVIDIINADIINYPSEK